MTELIGQTSAGRVHVVRHAFEPSKQLTELIEEFAGPNVRPHFLLRSTKEVFVDSVTYARGAYREEDMKARQAVEREKRHAFIIGGAAMHFLRQKSANPEEAETLPLIGYRLSLFPEEEYAFDQLASSLNVYPTVRQPAVRPHHNLLLDMSAGVAFYHRDRVEAEETFKRTIAEGVQRRLFSATIAGLRSIEVPYIQPSPQQPSEAS